jgi:hypothetical protein
MKNLNEEINTSRATLGKLPANAEKLDKIVSWPLETKE